MFQQYTHGKAIYAPLCRLSMAVGRGNTVQPPSEWDSHRQTDAETDRRTDGRIVAFLLYAPYLP